jgi:hypothetical protein
VIKQTELFDYTLAGTETRDRNPQTQACWYQSWLNDIGNGKCKGGWYDPLSTTPDIYVEQARQTILGGAKESLLHCYDYLDTDNPGIAVDSDSGVKYGKEDASALIQEVDGLQQMADLIASMKPQGILLAKKANEKPISDIGLLGEVGLLGIPFVASGDIKQNAAYFFTSHASNYNNLETVLNQCLKENNPFIFSSAFYNTLDEKIKMQFALDIEMSENTYLLRDKDGETTLLNDLFTMDESQLNIVRNKLIVPFGIQINAPRNVSLHLFVNENKTIEVMENFNNDPVIIKLIYKEKQKRKLKLGLPSNNKVEFREIGNKEYTIELAPRSLALISSN